MPFFRWRLLSKTIFLEIALSRFRELDTSYFWKLLKLLHSLVFLLFQMAYHYISLILSQYSLAGLCLLMSRIRISHLEGPFHSSFHHFNLLNRSLLENLMKTILMWRLNHRKHTIKYKTSTNISFPHSVSITSFNFWALLCLLIAASGHSGNIF